MNKWDRFLKDIAASKQVVLIGPLYNRTHRATEPTVYVDGGAQFRDVLYEDGNIPTVSVGDGDSAEVPLEVTLPKDKDHSDLAFVLRGLPQNIRHVELLGFLGARRDHELLNYGEVHHFLKRRDKFTTARFDEAIVAFSPGKIHLNIKGTFSVVAFEPTNMMVGGACQFPLLRPTTIGPVSSHGLSNVGFGDVEFNSVSPIFVFLS